MVCKVKGKCDLCGQEFYKNNLKSHVKACNGSPKKEPRFKGCQGGWNKGLTKETEPILAAWSVAYKAKIASGEIVPVRNKTY